VQLYPGGDANADEGMTSIYLQNKSNKTIEINFGFSVHDGNGTEVADERSNGPRDFGHAGSDTSGYGWGFDFAKRSTLLRSLVDGALVIKVNMKVASLPSFIPENPPACKMIQCAFLNNKYADIIFEVAEGKEKNSAMKVAKTAPVTFYAHRLVVANCSSIFAELCESHSDGTTPIQITGVSPVVFRLLLSYIYSVKIPEDEDHRRS
jgi:hypothetical protein